MNKNRKNRVSSFPMKNECYECFRKSAIKNSKRHRFTEENLKKLLSHLSEYWNSIKNSPPNTVVGAQLGLWKKYFELSGVVNPFQKEIDRSNYLALKCYEYLFEELRKSKEKLYTCLLISCCGNVIDFGGTPSTSSEINLEEIVLRREINVAMSQGLKFLQPNLFEIFKKKIASAKNILFISDNNGEIVFDKFLIEYLIKTYKNIKNVVIATRGKPVINDVTISDLEKLKLFDEIKEVKIIKSSEKAYCGTVLEECTKEFLNIYNKSDVIIAKGHGNFESLCCCGNKNLFLLLKIKCKIVAKYLNVKEKEYVLTRPLGSPNDW